VLHNTVAKDKYSKKYCASCVLVVRFVLIPGILVGGMVEKLQWCTPLYSYGRRGKIGTRI